MSAAELSSKVAGELSSKAAAELSAGYHADHHTTLEVLASNSTGVACGVDVARVMGRPIVIGDAGWRCQRCCVAALMSLRALFDRRSQRIVTVYFALCGYRVSRT